MSEHEVNATAQVADRAIEAMGFLVEAVEEIAPEKWHWPSNLEGWGIPELVSHVTGSAAKIVTLVKGGDVGQAPAQLDDVEYQDRSAQLRKRPPPSIPSPGIAEIHASVETSAEIDSHVDLEAVDLEAVVGGGRHDAGMTDVFVGSEAVACGGLTKSDLRNRHRAVFRDVEYQDRSARLRKLAEELRDALADADLDAKRPSPRGDVPLRQALRFPTLGLTIHAWDVYQSQARPIDVPGDLLAFCQQVLDSIPEDELRRPGMFGPAKIAPADASPTVRLMAFVGRAVD